MKASVCYSIELTICKYSATNTEKERAALHVNDTDTTWDTLYAWKGIRHSGARGSQNVYNKCGYFVRMRVGCCEKIRFRH